MEAESSRDESIVQEANLSRIRNLINQNKIKLWLDPYYDNDNKTPFETKMLQTANALAPDLEMDDMEVYNGMMKLQENALDKLKAREILNRSGQIELKLKLDKLAKEKNPDLGAFTTINIDAYDTGDDLSKEVSKTINLPIGMFKLVSAGSVIKSDVRLNQQNLKPGQTVMVLTVDHGDKAMQLVNEQRKILNEAKEDAERLGSRDQMTIADQSGKEVELPKEERQALIIAMSLHEKGKAALKKGNLQLAIVLLLEAKDEYNQCRSEILTAVDNYGLLNLDISWCYLRLGNLTELPNAQERLKECENSFKKSYGENLERVMALKGNSSNEAVLYVRLHLLQAICSYISGYSREALILLKKADVEFKILKVPDDVLEEVVAQGFNEREARLALRATNHQPTLAVRHIIDVRQKKEEIEKAEKDRNKRRKAFGKTNDDSWVNLGYLDTLIKMGYPETLAARALRHTNNEMNLAIDAMNETPELLITNYEDFDEQKITKEMIENVSSMGFDRDVANEALKHCKGDLQKTLDLLTNNPEKISDIMEKSGEEFQKTEDARKRMEEDIGEGDDHLDVTLEDEGAYLEKYKKLMKLI